MRKIRCRRSDRSPEEAVVYNRKRDLVLVATLLATIALALACSSTSSQRSNPTDTGEGTSATAVRGAATDGPAQGASPTAPVVNQQGATATALPTYSCRCVDFPSRPEAQRVYRQHGGANWSGLDPDGDGSICESQP